ncbi:serine/threonine-protein kinase RsbT [Paucimonas lemoignei]|uniref:Serine/threonine-protein kinase RsbT n=1 Tax=Paucimonas lemoignei TaxID=29443 RepID=A0A4R3HQY8_PAULE|nr:anti-sigma regulatory factor [Paucimonas lemoignei]TCS35184.1 serine/threonine-protein kinase RsbT [Paucimonas lemoignei]
MTLSVNAASADQTKTLPLKADDDIVRLRQALRDATVAIGFSLVDQTKFITAASELGRNTVRYGGGGEVLLQHLSDGVRHGIKLTFIDNGPGIPDIKKAMTDGYTTGGGLGLGLSGAKRLCDEFEIDSTVGKGTTVSVAKWKLR